MAKTSVMIIGGGLGGLALAHGLRRAGHAVQLYERDAHPDARAQGFRISVSGAGRAALEALLPPDRLAALDAAEVRGVGRSFAFAGADARPLLSFGDESGRTVRRPALRRLLADGLPISWGRRLVAVEEIGGAVRARFDDGTSASADLLVGCDGAGSDVRALLRSALGPTAGVPEQASTGVVSVGGVVDRTPVWDERLPLNRQGAAMYLGPRGRCLFVSFCERDDRRPVVLWALSRREEELEAGAWRALGASAGGRRRLRERCHADLEGPGWHPHLRALVAETADDAVVEPLELRTTRFPRRRGGPLWPSGRVTLLGDAAHTMPPQRGLGGNTAFQDAAALAAALGGQRESAEWPRVVGAYEDELFARGRKAVEESEETLGLLHLQNRLAVGVRGAVLRAVGAGLAWRARRRAGRAGAPTAAAGG